MPKKNPSKFAHLTQSDLLAIAKRSENYKEFLQTLGYGSNVSGSMKERIKKELLQKGVDVNALFEVWNARMADVDYVYRRYKGDAENVRNIHFELELEDFEKIVLSNCYYCGAEPGRLFSRSKEVKTNGVDRKDSKIGYTLDNCVPCCTTCNIMKQKMSVKDFYLHIRDIFFTMSNMFEPDLMIFDKNW